MEAAYADHAEVHQSILLTNSGGGFTTSESSLSAADAKSILAQLKSK